MIESFAVYLPSMEVSSCVALVFLNLSISEMTSFILVQRLTDGAYPDWTLSAHFGLYR